MGCSGGNFGGGVVPANSGNHNVQHGPGNYGWNNAGNNDWGNGNGNGYANGAGWGSGWKPPVVRSNDDGPPGVSNVPGVSVKAPVVPNNSGAPGAANPANGAGVPNFKVEGTLSQWSGGIAVASQITGLDPALIGGMVWAESRGNANITPTTNADGTKDLSLMQISQERWQKYVLPTITPEQRAAIMAHTGLTPEQLDMNNPMHNLIGGSLEISNYWLPKAGGNVDQALFMYVSGGDPANMGNKNYVADVNRFATYVRSGQTPPDV